MRAITISVVVFVSAVLHPARMSMDGGAETHEARRVSIEQEAAPTKVEATWYSEKYSCVGAWAACVTADGTKFRDESDICATWRYSLGTALRLDRETDTGVQRTTCVVRDRTAREYADRIDLSPATFKKLGGLEEGKIIISVREI